MAEPAPTPPDAVLSSLPYIVPEGTGFDSDPFIECLVQSNVALPLLTAEDAAELSYLISYALSKAADGYDSGDLGVAADFAKGSAHESPARTIVKALQLAGSLIVRAGRVGPGEDPAVAYDHCASMLLTMGASITAAEQRGLL